MRSWKAVTLTSAAKAYWILGAMIATIITARVLGPHGRGIIAATTSWVALFVTFGHLSLAHVIVYVAGARGRREALPAITGSLLAITAITTLAGWAIATTMYAATGGKAFQQIPLSALLVAFTGFPLLLWIENGNSLLVVMGDLKRLNVAQFAGTTAGIVLVVLAIVVARLGVTAALAATLGSYVVNAAVGLAAILREARPLRVSREISGEMLRGSARMHLGPVGNVLSTHAVVVLISHFRPVAEAGYFQLALQLTIGMQVVPIATGLVAYSIVARDGPDVAWHEHRRLLVQMLGYAFLAFIAAYVLAPYVVPLLAGRAFVPAVPIFRILALTIFSTSVAAVMSAQWVGRGYLFSVAMLMVVPALIGLGANVLLIPRYGMRAAAWMTTAAYMVQLAGSLWLAWRVERRAR
jgi:O-antigen/teichoic acid export membrane protein